MGPFIVEPMAIQIDINGLVRVPKSGHHRLASYGAHSIPLYSALFVASICVLLSIYAMNKRWVLLILSRVVIDVVVVVVGVVAPI